MRRETEILDWLVRAGLARRDEASGVMRLSGGVSSDVFRVDLPGRTLCVKQALEKLKVQDDWRAPVERSASEVAWLRTVAGLGGPVVPEVLAEDPDGRRFAMTWFGPADHDLWKTELAAGRVDLDFAAEVGRALAVVHAATAGREDIADRFRTDGLFLELRIAPYLLATADRRPELAGQLRELAATTLQRRIALVHGDVSPKNILAGPRGPVFLDAECAWYGDPAFDLAFCLNHLLLKSVWKPQHASAYDAAFLRLAGAYLDGVRWESAGELEARAVPLLGALMAARVDGKSPVEYLTGASDKAFVRGVAAELIAQPGLGLVEAQDLWRRRRREAR